MRNAFLQSGSSPPTPYIAPAQQPAIDIASEVKSEDAKPAGSSRDGDLMTDHPAKQNDELLTVADLAAILKCKESSVYNLTRRRGRARYDNPVPVLRLPMGLRFRRESVMTWLRSLETTEAPA